jgi:sugar O-acyltransferase (sialic acid O-acetyltransferase NeuD family)
MGKENGRSFCSQRAVLKTLILGAGGHAQVVADILLRSFEKGGIYKPIGFLDDDPKLIGMTNLSLPVLGTIAQLGEFKHDAVIVAIGDNHVRARIFQWVKTEGEKVVNAVHPDAILASDVRLGEGVMICAGVVVNTGTTIGDNVILNTGCTVDHHNHIDSHAHVAPGAHLGGNVCIGEGVLVGINAAILPGRSIGEWAVIGAGSVVTKDLPPYTIAVGMPARVIRKQKLKDQEQRLCESPCPPLTSRLPKSKR